MVTARSMVAKSKVARTRFLPRTKRARLRCEVTCPRTRAGAPHALRRNARATDARSLRSQRCTPLIPVVQATRSMRSVRRITSSAAKPRRQPIDVARPCFSHLANDPTLASAASSRTVPCPRPSARRLARFLHIAKEGTIAHARHQSRVGSP